jgi:hypothetical protein
MKRRDGHAMLVTATRTMGADRVAKNGANRQNECSRRQLLRRYGVA